ncbi:hypothetical protein [Nitrosomonas sp.]|uniref:hypothetical protein n=1 Tax=Nitrosomonas sp. TaxID=42353 RepID=UPI0032EF4214
MKVYSSNEMRKILLVIIFFFLSLSSAIGKDLLDEIVMINGEVETDLVISFCDSNKEWCSGYFAAVIHSLESSGKTVCIPRRKHQEGIWIIVKSWLYRQPQDKKITINQAVISALTENQCHSTQTVP